MSTPHNTANLGDFAKTVLMPGDPMRAKFIAETFLDNAKLVNNVRGINGYTGYYGAKRVSVMASGMGMPSLGIYAHELFTQYGVESIIRVGTAGGYSEKVKVRDIVLAMGASTNSAWADQYGLKGTFAPLADFDLLLKAKEVADKLKLRYTVGNILSSDIFYEPQGTWQSWAKMGVLGVEMETAALYMIAAQTGKKALSVLTISDHFIYTADETTSEEREKTMTDMMKIALEIAEE
jgi:purine-nucleoside phosphorylase